MIKKLIGTIWTKMPRAGRRKIVRMTQSKFTVSVAAVIINEKAEVLLLEHVLRLAFNWGFPGGFMESGEQPEEALRRELREETCLELRNIKLLRARTNARHIEILFSASAEGVAKVNSREIKALGWFKSDNLPAKLDRFQKSIIAEMLKSD